MTGAEAQAALEALGSVVRLRPEVSRDELVSLLAMALGASPRPPDGPKSTSAERMRRHRDRKRDAAAASQPVTSDGDSSPGDVTSDAKSDAIPSQVTSLARASSVRSSVLNVEKERTEDPERARRPVTSDGDAVTCPAGLAGAALDAGVLVELAALVREPLELVLAVADEFEAFWTLGGGAGELKANWMGQLREHVRRGGWRGKVKPPGLLEHERHIERELGVGLPPGWSRHPGIKGAYLDEAGRTRKRARA